jgi:hypothetical protein
MSLEEFVFSALDFFQRTVPARVEADSDLFKRIHDFVFSSYGASFFGGAVVIAVFAHRQLESYSAAFPKDQGIVLKLATASLLGGRRLFRRAYLYYLFVLELFYFVICTVQPVVAAVFPGAGRPSASPAAPSTPDPNGISGLIQNPEQAQSIVFGSPEWPLAAALLIVGLSPHFPIAVQIEATFRRFSQKVAGIPEYLLEIIDRIQRFDFDKLRPESPALADIFKAGDDVERAAAVLGIGPASAASTRRDVVCTLILQDFTLTKHSESIWAEIVRSRFFELSEILGPRVDAFYADLVSFLGAFRASRLIRQFQEHVRTQSAEHETEHPDLLESFLSKSGVDTDAFTDERRALLAHLTKIGRDASSLSNQMQALVALYLVNERPVVKKGDPILLLQSDVLATKGRFVADAMTLGIIAGFIVTSAALLLFELWKSIWVEQGFWHAMEVNGPTAVLSSANRAFGFLVIFGSAIAVAVFVRFSKVEQRLWTPMSPRRNSIPVAQYIAILLWSSCVAAAVNMTYYLVSKYLFSPPEVVGNILRTFFSTQFPTRLAYSFTGGLFGMFICYSIDRWEINQLHSRDIIWLPLVAGAAVTLFGIIVLIAANLIALVPGEAVGLFLYPVVVIAIMILMLSRVEREVSGAAALNLT